MNDDQKQIIDQRLEELCQAVGSALWEAQGVEQMLAKYYATAFKISTEASAEEIESEFAKNFSHTAGRLVGLLRDRATSMQPYADRLEEFVTERNWVVHKVRRQDFQSLYSEKAFLDLVSRVKRLEREAFQLIDVFHNLMIEHFVSVGVPREHIDKEIENELKRIYGS